MAIKAITMPMRVFISLFIVTWFLIMSGGTIYPSAKHLWAYWSARNWQQVPAQVLDVHLREHVHRPGLRETSRRITYSYSVESQYSFELEWRNYEGRRVGFDSGIYNSNWHHRWHATLVQARQEGAPVLVWVNPKDPQQSVIDRDQLGGWAGSPPPVGFGHAQPMFGYSVALLAHSTTDPGVGT